MKHLKTLLFIGLILNAGTINSQNCTLCAVSVSTVNSSSYTVTIGQTFCILAGGKFTGSLTINGGTLCNEGFFNPTSFIFNSGLIENYSSITLSNNFTLGNSCVFANEKRSIFRLKGILTIDGGIYKNHGINNIHSNINLLSGGLNNSGIINCKVLSGSQAGIINTGVINKD